LFTVTYLLSQAEVGGQIKPASHKLTCEYVSPVTTEPLTIDGSYKCYAVSDNATFLFGGRLQLSKHRCL